MTKYQNIYLAILRISLGFVYFYAGISKILKPDWSAVGYLSNAKTFANLYQWFALPEHISIINFINEWGLLLLGVSLIIGLGVRLSSSLGIMLMFLYYFPTLDFPYAGTSAFIIDSHIIYILILILFIILKAGRIYGLDAVVTQKIDSKFPKLHISKWVG
jgi:thiosulfate dehydrogenase [quinone] large subunit